MTNQAPWNLPPGRFITTVREIEIKKDRLELTVTTLEGLHAGQEIKARSPDRPKPKRKRWHP